jgi:hypothetical protein
VPKNIPTVGYPESIESSLHPHNVQLFIQTFSDKFRKIIFQLHTKQELYLAAGKYIIIVANIYLIQQLTPISTKHI